MSKPKLLRDFLADFLLIATCEETTGMIGEEYMRCGKPAVAIIKSRDVNPYAMCKHCAWHNVTNRNAALIFTTDENLKKALKRR
jgi:hypothetical protein